MHMASVLPPEPQSPQQFPLLCQFNEELLWTQLAAGQRGFLNCTGCPVYVSPIFEALESPARSSVEVCHFPLQIKRA